jgi:hypothetical protein
VELTDLFLVDSNSEPEVATLNSVHRSNSPAELGGHTTSLISHGFFSRLYVHLKQSVMDSFYNYCLPSMFFLFLPSVSDTPEGISELPSFSTSDVIMIGGKVHKNVRYLFSLCDLHGWCCIIC